MGSPCWGASSSSPLNPWGSYSHRSTVRLSSPSSCDLSLYLGPWGSCTPLYLSMSSYSSVVLWYSPLYLCSLCLYASFSSLYTSSPCSCTSLLSCSNPLGSCPSCSCATRPVFHWFGLSP